MSPGVGRLIAGAVVSGGLVVLAASCSGSPSATSSNTVTIKPSSYVVRDPVTTTSLPTDTSPTPDGRSPVEQTYTIEANDNPSQIAAAYDVDLEELRSYNGWAADYEDFPGVGGTVRIPPNARYIDPDATTTSGAESSDQPDETSDGESGTETTDGGDDGDCAPGEYTVQDGDNPTLIAQNFDVSLEALTAANGWDAQYSNFPGTGETIVIPPATDCTTVPGT